MTRGIHDTGLEPCTVCGESTAPGTAYFSDRRTLPDGTLLCSACQADLAAGHRPKRLTPEQARRLIDVGNMAAITWGNNGRI